MNQRANALESVHVCAELYYESQSEVEKNRRQLVDRIRKAKESGATQQAIADACHVGKQKLSRQRIAQLLAETT